MGVASQALSFIISDLKADAVRSIVLLGGTQASNAAAIRFYLKFEFLEYGEFYTAHNQENSIDMRLLLNNEKR